MPERARTGPGTLRVLDFGTTSALRSQSLWHALAHGVGAGGPATLSWCRGAGPYVSLGYHRHPSEVDLAYCRSRRLPVFRRMVGGGPVLVGPEQLLFQLCLPRSAVPAHRARALAELLGPVVQAYRDTGVPAELDQHTEVVLGDRKICGHGAGQIGDAVVVVGNLISGFDHQAATDILALPSAPMRAEVGRLMRRYVATTAADPARFAARLAVHLAQWLGLRPEPGRLSPLEVEQLARFDARLGAPEWLAAAPAPPVGRPRQVKVRAGVWVAEVEQEDLTVLLSVVADRIEHLSVRPRTPGSAPGRAGGWAQRLVGRTVLEARRELQGSAAAGLARALAATDGRAV